MNYLNKWKNFNENKNSMVKKSNRFEEPVGFKRDLTEDDLMNLNNKTLESNSSNVSSSINVKSMTIKYNPIDEEEGVYLGGGDYILELHTDKGIFYHKVKKLGELEDDGPDM